MSELKQQIEKMWGIRIDPRDDKKEWVRRSDVLKIIGDLEKTHIIKSKQKLKEILEIVKNRDRWDSVLSADTNYRLLQDRFKRIEKMLERLLGD